MSVISIRRQDIKVSIMNNDVVIRVGSFLAVFSLIALWEIKKVRWFNNLGITSIDALLVRLVFPVLAVNMAIKAQRYRNCGPGSDNLPSTCDVSCHSDPVAAAHGASCRPGL